MATKTIGACREYDRRVPLSAVMYGVVVNAESRVRLCRRPIRVRSVLRTEVAGLIGAERHERRVAEGLRPRFLRTATLLEEAAEDVLAYRLFPSEHQRQLYSTNVLEHLNNEIKRRSTVVGIFPSPKSTLRLVGAILLEQDDEWAVADRRYFQRDSMKQLAAPALSPSAQELLAAIG